MEQGAGSVLTAEVAVMDHRRFLKHFLEEQGVLKAYLISATSDLHAADDLLQEVSGALWESFSEYDESRPFRPWALGVARNMVLRWRRQKGRGRNVLSEETVRLMADTAETEGEGGDLRRAHLRGCLDAMGDHLRDVLRLRYLNGVAIPEVAHRIRKSIAAVEMILVRGRRALRDCVERKLHEAGELR
jgi:RNA polymerase sigma-70 factor, ECF subfamily